MKIHTLIVGDLDTNCYLVVDEKTQQTAVIDPGDEPEKILAFIKTNSLKPLCIVNTHGHPDHTGANQSLKKAFSIPILIHPADAVILQPAYAAAAQAMFGIRADSSEADRSLKDGEELKIGEIALKVIYTPGHSQGSICLHYENTLFSGDTMFAEGDYGRTDLWGGSQEQIEQSLRKLILLPPETRVYPGHGPATTLDEWKSMRATW